jgi:hypothetical protein
MRARSKNVLLVTLAAALAIVAACAGCGSSSAAKSSQPTWVKSEIYCGLEKQAGGTVTQAEFADFLNQVVTPAFPAGLTVFDAYGQMQKTDKAIVKQTTKVLLLVHQKTKANADAIQKVISSYRSRYGNPQVMYLQSPTNPQFISN